MKKLLVILAITATALFANSVEDMAMKAVDTAADEAKTAVVATAQEAIAPKKKEEVAEDANKTEEKK